MSELKKYRDEIDKIDEGIVDLLNRRTDIVLKIKKTKEKKNIKRHSPEREREILERIKKLNTGPFPAEALKIIYREILSASLSLEQPVKIAYLGPSATFTHLAAMRMFGSSAEYLPVTTIKAVFEAVSSGDAQYGVVPVENSTEGVVNYTLDMFVDSDLKIASEMMLEISHNLLSKTGRISDIRKIYSFAPATAQCRNWIEQHLPGIPILQEQSTAAAARRASKDPSCAAVASELAASMYKLKFVKRGIENYKSNFTRFLVIANDHPPRTGKDKTSIMFSIKDKAGALYSILNPFSKYAINLTKIESRPSKRKAWEYIFFVDVAGHIQDKNVNRAVNEVKKQCLYLKVLGSYPSAE
ncbi:MAG: prephenate dehydratase [Nitrospirae bacterium]|nr:prephenate dehydratase [Nitrospirota bacterium]